MPIQVLGAVAAPPVILVSQSQDGIVEVSLDQNWGGAVIIVDSTTVPTATHCRVWQRTGSRGNTRDIVVRGTDLLSIRTGRAIGYDFEAPLGQPVSWYVKFYDVAGKEIKVSHWATLDLPEPDATPQDPGLWLKHLSRPYKSCQVQINEWPEESYETQVDLEQVWGNRYSLGGVGVVTGFNGSVKVLTHTKGELVQLRNLLSEPGVFFVQPHSKFLKPSFYGVVANFTIANATEKMSNPARITTLSLREVGRPTTLGSRIIMPRRTYADRRGLNRTYGAIPNQTYLTALVSD